MLRQRMRGAALVSGRASDGLSYRHPGKAGRSKGGNIVTTTRGRGGEQNPLQSDLGTTTIQDAVVTSIAGIAAQEVEGINMSHGGTRLPGDTSPTVGEFVSGIAGSRGGMRGVSVDVGENQTAVDLTVNIDYGRPIPQTTQTVRQNVIRRVESLTGLEVTEVNIAVNDVTFPEQ